MSKADKKSKDSKKLKVKDLIFCLNNNARMR